MRRSLGRGLNSCIESTVEAAALSWLTQLVFGELPVDSRTHERASGRWSEMIRLLTARVRMGLVAAAMVATVPMITFAQTTDPAIASAPVAAKEGEATASPTGDENDSTMQRVAIPAPVEVELQRHFNELQGELLDDRAKTIDWWLAIIAIFLTFLAIILPIGAFIGGRFGFKIFNEIKEEAQRHLEDIKESRAKADSLVKGINAEAAGANPDKASEAVESVQQNPDSSPIDRAVVDALLLQQQGKIEKAIEKWRAVALVAEGIDNDLAARAWFSVGYLLQQEGEGEADELKLEKVIAAYDEAIRLKPNFAEVYNNRSVAKNTLGRHDAAIADCDEAIRLRSDFAEAYNNRGAAKNALGRHDAAIADCNEAIRLKPDYAEAYNNRGNAKDTLGRHDAAIVDFDEAIRLRPDFAEVYNNRGDVKDALGRHDAAIVDFDEAIRLRPDFAKAYYNRAIAKDNLDQYEYAIADFDEAIRLKPDYAIAYNGRGAAKNALGRHEAAIADYDEAIRLNPNLAEAYYNRGVAKKALGLVNEARTDFENTLVLARNAGNQELVAKAEEKLGNLAMDGGS